MTGNLDGQGLGSAESADERLTAVFSVNKDTSEQVFLVLPFCYGGAINLKSLTFIPKIYKNV